MIIDKIKLPNWEHEKDYFLSGGGTVGMPAPPDGCVPFNVFPKKRFDTVAFNDVTVFCGGSNSEKNLLLRIIAALLGKVEMPEGMSQRCLRDYLDLCCVVHTDYEMRNDIRVKLVTKAQSEEYIRRKYADIARNSVWSVLDFYENTFEEGVLYLIEEPENGMSLSELEQFALLVLDFAKSSGCQFVITTNSPVILGIPNALIYDFDAPFIVPRVWHSSEIAKQHANFYENLRKEHRMKQNET